MKEPVKVLMVAINGYGHYYLKTMLEETDCEKAVLVGVIDPEADRSKYHHAFKEFGIPVCDMMSDFYLSGGKADLAVISSPPHFHVPQSMLALHHGTNVLCEKPISGLLSDIAPMIGKRDKSGKFVMIGYQWSFSEGIQLLKKDILDGRFGKPKRMKSMCLWPRDYAYFSRNKWAYRKTDPDGNVVMDNLFNNAMSHFIHNMFFLLGESMDTSAVPVKTEAQTARAFQLETYDTGAFRSFTQSGTELLFLASHAAEKRVDPCFRIDFGKGFVELKTGADKIIARTLDKKEIYYPSPDSDHQFKKLFAAIDCAAGNGKVICSPEAAMSQAIIADQTDKICSEPFQFPQDRIERIPDRLFVKGLDDLLLSCYRDFRMPIMNFSK
jgi:predicted dehydrogenase